MVSNFTVGNVTFCHFKEGHNCRMKKYNFLNINPTDTIVLTSCMLLLYIYHQTVSKPCFLVGESMCQSYVYFQALKRQVLAKLM